MGLDPGQRARRPSPDAPEAPGDGYRADLAAFLLDLPGNAPGGGGHTVAPSIHPPCHERTVCRQGYPGVPGVRYCSMGEDNQLPHRHRTVGKGVIHHSQPTGGGTTRGSHRRPFPDFVRLHRRVRISVGTAARCAGKTPGLVGGNGTVVAVEDGRNARPVPGGPGRSLAPRAGDAGSADAAGAFG